MKYKFLLALLSFFCSNILFAQQKKSTAFAITSSTQGQMAWTEVKLIDLNSGEVVQNIFENNKPGYQLFSARGGKSIQIKTTEGLVTDNSRLPFSTFSAACAFDKKHNRLYFTPMYINELRYIDLNAATPKFFYFNEETFSKAINLTDAANHITRMVIGADGNGYALTNDGNHFIKFTTGRNPVITDLGSLQDNASNEKISVHNRCTSWGGDMIAAADGSLYLISASHSIFSINPDTRSATYIGSISGLPEGFTSNGAVVDDNGNLVISSATATDAYYSTDMKTWKAKKISSTGKVFNTSDLANGNIAFQNQKRAETLPLLTRNFNSDKKISLYPNPVSEGIFRVSFDNNELGKYEIQMLDLTGRVVVQKSVSVGNKGQVVEVELNKPVAKGTYFVKVLSSTRKAVYADKIIIE